MTSAYIHIPFCDQICFYCDFPKVLKQEQPVDDYIDALIWEIQARIKEHATPKCETLYIGGGTPSILSVKQLDRLLATIRRFLPFTEGEFSFEVNPGDLSKEKLAILEYYGVNRLSLGVQTLNDDLLRKIGRKHRKKEVYTTLEQIDRYSSIQNVSLDLIYALPGQTLADFQATLQEALHFHLPHFSLYALILENQTVFANWARQGKLLLPEQEEEVAMEEWAEAYLQQAGYQRYELSNYAKPGYESQHNLMYWNNEAYYGFGAGASGYLANQRYRNHGPIQHYLAACQAGKLPTVEVETLDEWDQMEEELFLGLRKREGISIRRFERKFSRSFADVYGSVAQDYITEGYLSLTGDQLALTKKGRLFGNDVFAAFLIDREEK